MYDTIQKALKMQREAGTQFAAMWLRDKGYPLGVTTYILARNKALRLPA